MHENSAICQLEPSERAALLRSEMDMLRRYKVWLEAELARAKRRFAEVRREVREIA